ncbi:hypothetical protein MAPG_04152 [Magnaporthiopsis poae ATCC 64411]|uniref:Uncharacterized protein n=1 Tax=Magnaporthiopsis poae (strain ATCC 64411 / 73-15) TaxID=644358 RepID=A0A0C4DVY5_MAGP6|nr:hypothetical protein MAPG_04152 [Magnaporthiopsis poae ATCC 64411]
MAGDGPSTDTVPMASSAAKPEPAPRHLMSASQPVAPPATLTSPTISLEQVVQYIKTVETFREAKRRSGRAWADWQAQNQNVDIFSPKYPPPVFVQKEPEQRDFDFHSFSLVTLQQVLDHPYCEWVDIGY